MEPLLDDEQTQVRDSARRLCKDFAGPAKLRTLQGRANIEAWQQIAQAGWPGLLVPVEQEGLGMGLFELSLIMEACGQHLLLAPVLATCTANLALAASLAGSNADQVKAIVMVDEDDPYRAGSRWPTATACDGGYRIDGAVPSVEDLADAHLLLVPCHVEGGSAMLAAIRRHSPGVTTKVQTCIDTSRADSLTLDAVFVAANDVVAQGDAALSVVAQINDALCVGTSAELIGLAEAALALALDHLKTRKQFGKHLASFQALQHRCVDGFLDIELNRSLLYRVSSALDKGQGQPAMVAALKARASKSALSITRAAVQLHGAMGYTEAHDIGLYYKRATVLAARYGNENRQAAVFSALTLNCTFQ